MIFVSNLCIEC